MKLHPSTKEKKNTDTNIYLSDKEKTHNVSVLWNLITFTLKQILHGDVPISTCGISLRYVGFSYAQLEARGVWIIPVKEVKICLVKCLVYKCPQWVGVVCPYILWKAFKSYCMSHTVKQYTASIFSMLFSAVFKVLIIIIHLLWIHGSIFFYWFFGM